MTGKTFPPWGSEHHDSNLRSLFCVAMVRSPKLSPDDLATQSSSTWEGGVRPALLLPSVAGMNSCSWSTHHPSGRFGMCLAQLGTQLPLSITHLPHPLVRHTPWLVCSIPSFPPEQQYNQEITDLKQPVLVSQPKRRRGPGGTLPGPAMLIPELCYLTGAQCCPLLLTPPAHPPGAMQPC